MRTYDSIVEMNHPGALLPCLLELRFSTGMHIYLPIAEDVASIKVSIQTTYFFTTRSALADYVLKWRALVLFQR